MKPTTSFIIGAFNAEKFLSKAIESCLNQSIKPDKILIADDGSTDNTRNILLEYRNKFPEIIELSLSDVNEGRAVAINRLIDRVTTDYTLLLDADDEAKFNRVERQVFFMENNPEVVLSSSFISHIDNEGRKLGVGSLDLLSKNDFDLYINQNRPIGLYCPSVIIKSSVFLDSTLRFRQKCWPVDDIDFWNRVAEKGFLILVQPEILTNYRVHAGSVSVAQISGTRLKFEYVCDCMWRRRGNINEITFEEFCEIQSKRPWYIKLSAWRKNTAQGLYRKAEMCFSGRENICCIINLSFSILLQPSYALPRVWNQFFKKSKMEF